LPLLPPCNEDDEDEDVHTVVESAVLSRAVPVVVDGRLCDMTVPPVARRRVAEATTRIKVVYSNRCNCVQFHPRFILSFNADHRSIESAVDENHGPVKVVRSPLVLVEQVWARIGGDFGSHHPPTRHCYFIRTILSDAR
jgi:hypothetical protein